MVKKKRIALLGITGSIGKSTLEVVREQSDKFEIVLASAHSNANELTNYAAEFSIKSTILTNEQLQPSQLELPAGCTLYHGETELVRLLKDADYDIALNAISGSAGLKSTMAILETGKPLALANKESLVMAGHLVRELQKKHGSSIIPVDSEHSALFQAIGKHRAEDIRKAYLTASGGAFRTLPLDEFGNITPTQALQHPNWKMGAKVTLDSATMFNKALEVMEAHWLFDLDWEQIEAVIHPQSVIHSMVEFNDGSILAQMSVPDMRLPILYALTFPERYNSHLVQTDILKLPALTFEAIDPYRYPLFYLGVKAAKQGGIMPTVVNAANEAALELFLRSKIRFLQIPEIVSEALDETANITTPDLETIIAANTTVHQRIISAHLSATTTQQQI